MPMLIVMPMLMSLVIGDADGDDEGGDNNDGGVGGEGYKPQCLDLVRVALHQDFGLRKIRSH